MIDNSNGSCTCSTSFDCVYPAGVYELSTLDAYLFHGVLQSVFQPSYTISGMFVGCFPLNALLQSTLECLFNSTCLELIQSSLLSNRSISVKPLNDTIKSNFDKTTTVQAIMAKLMIEEWTCTSSYAAFYQQCQPELCTYSFISKGNLANVIAIVVASFGGLSVTLKVVAPFLVTMYRKRPCINRRIQPSSTSITPVLFTDCKLIR